VQPKPAHYTYQLEEALGAVVGLRVTVPQDAFTAETLGTERAGNGVLIRRDGLLVTIGYLVTEAESVWVTLSDGRVLPGHVLAYDQETGLGLVQVLARVELPFLKLGNSSALSVEDHVVVAGAGGLARSIAARVVAKQEFAGYWEYLLDEAIFTAPAHPNWGGTALINPDGELAGIGSLQLQQGSEGGKTQDLNMMVPIDVLKPILGDLLKFGRTRKPPRPWLGLFAAEVGRKLVVAGLSQRGPARRAGIRVGDVLLAVGENEVNSLSGFFRRVWSLGEAGVEVPLVLHREGRAVEVRLRSADRASFLKGPVLH
jgi:S1-C subfamily serine protease